MNAQEITRAIGGRWCGSYGMARCPVHEDKRPSMTIRDGDRAVLFNCHAGCTSSDIAKTMRARGLQSGHFEPIEFPVKLTRNSEPEPEPDPTALALWRETEPIGGTLAARYLRQHRGIGIEIPVSLRFHPGVTYPRLNQRFPALVAAVARPDRRVIAAQLTYLRPDGQKCPLASPRLTFGRLGTGAVRLAPVEDVLGLAEGVESALSAMELSGVPTWATLGGKRLGRITLPDTVREVHIFADNDDAGRLMAERAAGIYTRAGRRVVLRWPPEGCGDWNDAGRRPRKYEVAA